MYKRQEQVPEKELPAEEPKENAENPQEAKAEEAKKEEKPSELDTVKGQLAKEHDGYLRLLSLIHICRHGGSCA